MWLCTNPSTGVSKPERTYSLLNLVLLWTPVAPHTVLALWPVQTSCSFALTTVSNLFFFSFCLGQSAVMEYSVYSIKMYSFSPSSLLLYFLFIYYFWPPSSVAHVLDRHAPPALPTLTLAQPPPAPERPPAHLTLPVGPAHKLCPSLNGHLTWHLVIECPCPMPTSSTTTTTTSAHAVQCQCISPWQQWPRAVCPTSYCLTAWLEQSNTCLW